MAKQVQRRTQAERREEAESRLLQYATKLVAERGYDGFTLADVADAAGYSRGLPGHYFGRKEDLLARVVETTIDLYYNQRTQRPAVEPGLPTIEETIRHYVQSRSIALRALQILFAQALVQPGLRQTIARLNAQGMANIEAEIRAGIAAGNIRPDVDVSHHAAVIYSFLRGQMHFATLDPSFEEVAVAEEFIGTIRERLRQRK